jgi:hypothetical protein
MKRVFLPAFVLVAVFSSDVFAACPVVYDQDVTDVGSLLTNSVVCVANGGNWDAQEYHKPGGELWDYKKGPNPPETVDPTAIVGSWSASGNTVTYTYGETSYVNNVKRIGTTNQICFTGTSTEATIKTQTGGPVSCP